MIMKANKQIGFIYKDNESIDKILKDGEVVFERGFLREKTSTTLPITFGGVGKDLKDYKIYGNTKQQLLPDGYTQVDYIESDGNQYINTGVNADSNLSVKMNFSSNYHIQQRHMGAIKNDNGVYTRHHITINGSSAVNYLISYSGQTNSAQNLLSTIDDNKHYLNLDIYNKKISADEETPIDLTLQPFDTGLNYWLFARNSNNSTNISFAIMRIYDCKMFYKGVLVRDFIPCYRNSDNEIGLYDLVNKVFYTNQRTGVFTYGSIAPTPDTPIEMVSCGDLVTDSQDEHYGKYKIPVNVRSDNLFDKDNANILNAYLSEQKVISSNSARCLYIRCEPNTTYTVHKRQGNRFAVAYSEETPTINSSARITQDNTASNITITTNNTANYLIVWYYSGTYDTTISEEQMRESVIIIEGSTAPSKYIPYYNETTNIYLDEPLRKIGEYSDYIDFINGKVIRNIKEVILNGNESNWALASTYTNTLRFQNTTALKQGLAIADIKIKSNLFTVSEPTDNSDKEHIRNAVMSYPEFLFIFINKNRLTGNTVNDFKAWLQTHNVTVNYTLETPTEESITLPNIPTMDGNNTLNIETEITPSQVYIKYKSNE